MTAHLPPAPPPPEFSRPVVVESLHGDQAVREIEAGAAECRALAGRFRLQAVHSLRATVRLSRLRGHQAGMVQVKGTLTAEVVQTCVVTLEPVPESVTESFSALFSPDAAEDDQEMVLDPAALDEDLPEPLIDGVIDIGELTAQHLSLALDPYPRAPGVEFTGYDDDERPAASDGEADGEPGAGPAPSGPFGALAALKRRH